MKRKVLDIVPPYTFDDDYGLELYEIYHHNFSGLFTLFKRGVTGLCLGTEKPVSMKELAEISSGVVATPENYKVKGEIPTITQGSKLCCKVDGGSVSGGQELLLRGVFSSMIENLDEEGAGEAAVAVCSTLASNNYRPNPDRKKGTHFALRDISMTLVDEDFLIEVLIVAGKKTDAGEFLPLPPARDGRLDLKMLARAAGKEG